MVREIDQIRKWLETKFPGGEIPDGVYTIPLGEREVPCKVTINDVGLSIGPPYCITYTRAWVDSRRNKDGGETCSRDAKT